MIARIMLALSTPTPKFGPAKQPGPSQHPLQHRPQVVPHQRHQHKQPHSP